MKLIATAENLAHRVGEEFEEPDAVADVLLAIGHATKAPPPSATRTRAMTPEAEDMSTLRAEYERVVGRRPFMGWGADELRERIAAAPATYSRRDMRAED